MNKCGDRQEVEVPPSDKLCQTVGSDSHVPGPSCLSMKSDNSMEKFIDLKDGRCADRSFDELSSDVVPDQTTQLHENPSIFTLLKEDLLTFVKNELVRLQRVIDPDYRECEGETEEEDTLLSEEDAKLRRSSRDAFLKITLNFLRKRNQDKLAEHLLNSTYSVTSQDKLKGILQKKVQNLFEGLKRAGDQIPLHQIYTELSITKGEASQINDEHEIRQIECLSRSRESQPTTLGQDDIFRTGKDGPVRTMMTTGVAGIGKTVLTQKFALDWAEGRSNQDIKFMFLFTFRELNLLRDKPYSLEQLIRHFFIETRDHMFEDFKVAFIFDGLDECRLPLDFRNNKVLTDVSESTSVDVLLTNLISGKLLPSAHIWITTRPAAASRIPPECVGMVTQVTGFTDSQKKEYFLRRLGDSEKTQKIISHVKTSRSLHIMCHIPVFCWITATVLENMWNTKEGEELPKTLTEMYIHFLVYQAKARKAKYDGGQEMDQHWNPESKGMIESLGKLSFQQLQLGNLIFYESDLTDYDIDISAASVSSGVFTQIFKEERGLYQDKVFCFVQLTVQEFLAALHVHLTFVNSGVNLLAEEGTSEESPILFYQSAVNKALESPNGHLDLFLRFLLGLSLQSNQRLLQGLLTKKEKNSEIYQKTVEFIKEKIGGDVSPEKAINLLSCLKELNDCSLLEEVQSFSGKRLRASSESEPSSGHWSALAFIVLSSVKDTEVFDLKIYSASEKAFLRFLPVMKESKKTLLSGCNLSERSCEAVRSVLSARSCALRELDLSNNNLQDAGVQLLSAALESPRCRLESLNLSGCLVTGKGCASLASALGSNLNLRELNLSYNHPGDSGVELLSCRLKDPSCGLKNLKLEPCGEQWLTPGLRKYACKLKLDVNTANKRLRVCDKYGTVTHVEEDLPLPDHSDRFDCEPQLMCINSLMGRSYWEVERDQMVSIAVTYRGIKTKGKGSEFGYNDQSWRLFCSDRDGYYVSHGGKTKSIDCPVRSEKVGVYVDRDAGILSFYTVSHDKMIHLHTYSTKFTQPLYPGFAIYPGSSISLCGLE